MRPRASDCRSCGISSAVSWRAPSACATAGTRFRGWPERWWPSNCGPRKATRWACSLHHQLGRTDQGRGPAGDGPLRGAAAGGQPGLAQFAALLFGGATPHARLLVGGEGEVETRLESVTAPADSLGRVDLVDGRPGGADGEEEVGLGTAASGHMPPVTVVPLDRTAVSYTHLTLPTKRIV